MNAAQYKVGDELVLTLGELKFDVTVTRVSTRLDPHYWVEGAGGAWLTPESRLSRRSPLNPADEHNPRDVAILGGDPSL